MYYIVNIDMYYIGKWVILQKFRKLAMAPLTALITVTLHYRGKAYPKKVEESMISEGKPGLIIS